MRPFGPVFERINRHLPKLLHLCSRKPLFLAGLIFKLSIPALDRMVADAEFAYIVIADMYQHRSC
ncbi:hypothetical protein D3C78_1710240 [compost metagenome]